MSRRERLEARIAKRREWQAKRQAEAERLEELNAPYRGDHALMTQPGKIPERTRMNQRSKKAWQNQEMADRHEQKADALEAVVDKTIFSDDPDAVERLEERIDDLEAQRDRIVEYNKSARQAAKNGRCGDLSLLSKDQQNQLHDLIRVAAFQVRPGGGFPPYVLSSLGAEIRRNKKRLEAIRA